MSGTKYPGLMERIQALILDSVILVIFMFAAYNIFEALDNVPVLARQITFIFIFGLYDPLCTSILGGTLGHRAFKLRVKRESNPDKNIWFIMAVIRFVAKAFLGIISLLIVSSNSKGKGIHDFIAGSVVVYKSKSK